MKKIMGVLGIVMCAWIGAYMQTHDVPQKAWAGITCSLPIILQNGTTADAGQVMQNFNALSACFNNVATVSSVTCGAGLDGGVITGVGTCSLSAARRTTPSAQVFLGGGGTYTAPTNVQWLEVYMVGGGGGGMGTGVAQVNGANGSTTTFGSATAPGGSGSGAGAGTSTGCTFTAGGGSGSMSSDAGTGTFGAGGGGGNSFLGGGGLAGYSGIAGNGGNGAANTGGGGGGAGSAGGGGDVNGYGGGSGAYCYTLIGNPPATIPFTVGSGGAGGVGSAFNGGAGGNGAIYVVEHYN